jgi:AraC-like DNA-binding protein
MKSTLFCKIRPDRRFRGRQAAHMAETIALLLRGTALGFVVLLLAVGPAGRARRALWPLLLCLVAYLLRSAPEVVGAPLWVLVPLSIGALLFPLAFWWLVRIAFDDRTDLPWAAAVVAGLLVIAGLGSADTQWQALQKALAAAFMVSALWRLTVTWAEDLVSGRRRVRLWVVAYTGAHGLAVLAVELLLGGQRAPGWLDAVNVAVIVLALGVTAAYLLRSDFGAVQTLFGPAPEQTSLPATPSGTLLDVMESATHASDVDDTAHLLELERLMTVKMIYRDPELTLAVVAQQLGLPQYRVRDLIHNRLGHRNFPTFVNAYRLAEVEQRLLDPALVRRPILTLALEAGFGSIGPFNRAFRERHGLTPTEYRKRTDAGDALA